MITYTFTSGDTLTNQLYNFIKEDIVKGILKEHDKLPSKRALAKHLNISTITVENAYLQLLSEGYIYSKPRSGYYVSHVDLHTIKRKKPILKPEKKQTYWMDFSSNSIDPEHFPFTPWAKISRHVISNEQQQLLDAMGLSGVWELREAIARYLLEFKDIEVSPEQIIIGAGSEYFYGLLIQFFGPDVVYGLEIPGYATIKEIYESYHVHYTEVPIDQEGLRVDALRDSLCEIVHVTPSHHFPTGITMPISRRGELLSWASELPTRYIIEDDYDSEFRMMGKPLPSLFSIDTTDHVLYMNTFTKSLASTIRVGYLVLPVHLVETFKKKFSFYTCPVSSFGQHILAHFIAEGYFEKHINRMRTSYKRKRDNILEIFKSHPLSHLGHISEENAGLHFLLTIDVPIDVEDFKKQLRREGVKIKSLSDYGDQKAPIFIINYSSIPLDLLNQAFDLMVKIIKAY